MVASSFGIARDEHGLCRGPDSHSRKASPTVTLPMRPFGDCALIVVAAGEGTRCGGRKQLARAGGKPLLVRTLEAFSSLPFAARILVLPADLAEGQSWETLSASHEVFRGIIPVCGGATRAQSVRSGLAQVPGGLPFAAVQDGARPLPPLTAAAEALELLAGDKELAGVAVCSPATDAIKRLDSGGRIVAHIPREGLIRAETPQMVRVEAIRKALDAPGADQAPDDMKALELAGFTTAAVLHSGYNPKITHPGDIVLLEAWLKMNGEEQPPSAGEAASCPFSIGFGYDVHRFAPGRRLMLGGVEIESDVGLLGHSDADVLLHAVCDALLGAAGLGDIGHHFPNTDATWKDADSRVLLRESVRLIRNAGWAPAHLDISVVAERPKIAPHIEAMRGRLAEDTGLSGARIGLKATTNEGMGFIGRGEGIAAMATALLWRADG